MHYLYQYISNASKQNLSKLYNRNIQNISNNIPVVIIAWTVRAVNSLDLIVENGYPVTIL